MDLQINSKSHVPVHVQLKEQIKHLILTDAFVVGEQLPSIRALAGYLRVNRNTVARVISDLEREGYVESRRGSGVYVVEPPVDADYKKRQEVLERVLDLAAAQEVPVEDLAYALLARASVKPREKIRMLFIECTDVELEQFTAELESQLPVEVEGVVLEDLADRISQSPELPWSVAATTFFHVHEVQEIVEPYGIETVALLAEANLESLQKLTKLQADTPVGLVGWDETCMDNMSRSVEGAGLDHLKFVPINVDDTPEEIHATLSRVSAVLGASVTAQKLRERVVIPENIQVIEEDRVLDQGGIEMLGGLLRNLPRPGQEAPESSGE